MKYDIIVIGSGLGGLECSNILARAGKSVLLLEQGTQIGGCLQSYKRDGMTFDTGFHYVGGLCEGQALHAAFRYLNLLQLPWKRLDDYFDYVTIGKQTYPFAQGFEAFFETLAEKFPTERQALAHYVDLLQNCGKQQFSMFNPHAGDISNYLSNLMETNAYDYLARTFHDSQLINVLSGTALKMELRRESLPLLTFLDGNVSFIESSWRLQGDGTMLANTLADNLRSYGGEIICRAKVTELVEKNGRIAYAVCSNGEHFEGDLFISDVHPSITCNFVKQSERMKRTYRNRISKLANTFGMFTVSLRIKPQTIPYFNHNHYVYRQANVWDFHQTNSPVGGIIISCRVPDEGNFVKQIDLMTPMPWELCKAWSDTHVGKRGYDYEMMKKELANECIKLAENIIPGLESMISGQYTSTPLTYRDYTGTPDGSAYGVRKDCRNPLMTFLSPQTPIPNLLLTGQNIILHGIHGVTMTSLLTCAEVLGKDWIWNNILKD